MKVYVSVAVGLIALGSAAFGASGISDRAAGRFLDQATWGPTPASIVELQNLGFDQWLNRQFALNVSDIPDQPLLASDGVNVNTNIAPVQAAFLQNAISQPDQLRQRVAFALSQIWVVSQVSGVPNAYAYPPYWRIFRDLAFGNYRDIIKAVTLNPAMGRYLNMANNNKANPAAGTAANENYARELMQLFTLGLTQLNPDGSPVLDSKKNPVPTYDQDVVDNVSKALTGWTYPTAPGATAKANNPAYYIGQMFAVQAEHDTTQKTILGNVILPAGRTAEQDLDSVIDSIMAQRTIAPFICQQLIQHLVTSSPSPAYIERVSNIFLDDGRGIRGDMHAVIRAILLDPEARAGDSPSYNDPNFGHLREPILFMTSMLRGLNATVDSQNTIAAYASNMGENLFNEPSVFSYFSPEYRTENGLSGPEFQIYSTQTAAYRIAGAVNNAIYGTLDKTTKLDLTPFTNRAGDMNSLLDYISYVFLHSSMSSDVRQAAMSAAASQSTPQKKAQSALYVVLSSPEYQVIY